MNAEVTNGSESGLNASELAASLTVKDLATSAAWYRDIVGFTIDRRHERDGRLLAVSLRAGQVRLLITQDDGARGLDRTKGVGFALQLSTPQDIDALAGSAGWATLRGNDLNTANTLTRDHLWPLNAMGLSCRPSGFLCEEAGLI